MKQNSFSSSDEDLLGYGRELRERTNDQLIATFNFQVGIPCWIRSRLQLLHDLFDEFQSRDLDCSSIIKGTSSSYRLKLVGKKIELLTPWQPSINYPLNLSSHAKSTVKLNDRGAFKSSNNSFMKSMALHSVSVPFIRIEQLAGSDVGYTINYCLTDDHHLQLILNINEESVGIIVQIKLKDNDTKKNLILALKEYLWESCHLGCYPSYEESQFLTKSEYARIVKELENKLIATNFDNRSNGTELIQYMKKLGLGPELSEWNSSIWFANCPSPNGYHFLTVSSESDTFDCGNCDRHGNLTDFRRWVEEISSEE